MKCSVKAREDKKSEGKNKEYEKCIENNYNYIFQYIYITLSENVPNSSTKTETVTVGKKKQVYIFIMKPTFNIKTQIKVKGQRKKYHTKINQNNMGVQTKSLEQEI